MKKSARKRAPKVTLTPAQQAWVTRRKSGDPSASARQAWETRRAAAAKAAAKGKRRTAA